MEAMESFMDGLNNTDLPNIMANSVPTIKEAVSINLVSLPYKNSVSVY
jgi:hypothetical protein